MFEKITKSEISFQKNLNYLNNKLEYIENLDKISYMMKLSNPKLK